MTQVPMKVDTDTGEVLPVPAFDRQKYLAELASPAWIQAQQDMAAAYDAAVRALVGPNDIQLDGGREFKKKSAWRKLGRHFGVSTRVVSKDIQPVGPDGFVATVVVEGRAPWGQVMEAVGSCGTDEETGRRVITMADAMATAQTRATNRAVSDLVAMGEVSAEEIQKGQGGNGAHAEDAGGDKPAREPRGRTAGGRGRSKGGQGNGQLPDAIPFGRSKGTKLVDASVKDLESLKDWCVDTDAGKFADLVQAITLELDRRKAGMEAGVGKPAGGKVAKQAAGPGAPESMEDFPESLEDEENDGLPF